MNAARRLLFVLLGMAAFVLTVAPAQAADELGLSRDGVTWADELDGPLFDPAFRWVPGDTESAIFYVRNQSSDSAVLDVAMLTGPVEGLIDTGDLRVSVAVDNLAPVSATSAGEHQLVSQVSVAAGAVRRITVAVDFDFASGNESESRKLDLEFDVTLSQNTAVQPPTTDGGGNAGNGGNGVDAPGSGGLPGTGSVITPALFWTAVLLCTGGFALAGWARRPRRNHDVPAQDAPGSDERQTSHA